MPQIPVFAESQVLSPGNPVPIGEADVPFEKAMNQLGDAMERLGIAMDKEQKAKKNKIKQYNVQSAAEEYESRMRTYNQETLWLDPASREDLTGLTARRKSIEEGDRLAAEMVSESGFDLEQQAMFDATRRKIQNQLDPDLMIKSSQETDKAYKLAVQQNVNLMSAQVSQDPRLFDVKMNQIVEDVANDNFAINKQAAVAERQKQLAMGAYNNFRFRNAYKEAKTFLETTNKQYGLFTPEEMAKELNALDADRTAYVNRLNTEEIRADRNHDKAVAGLQAQKAVLLYEQIESAAAQGAFAVDKVKQAVMLEGLRGQAGDGSGITQQAMTQLLNHQPTAQRNIDEAFVGKMLSRAFETGNFNRAIQETNRRFEQGLLSAPTYAKTISDLGRYQQFQRNRTQDRTWDISKEAYRNMMDYYKTIGKDPMSISSVEQRKMFQVIFSVLNDVQQQQQATGKVDIKGIMDNATRSFGAEYGLPAAHTPSGVQRPMGSVEDLQKVLRDKALQIKNGSLTIEQRRAIQKDMRAITDQIKQRKQDEIIRGNNAGSTSNGARSANAVQRTR